MERVLDLHVPELLVHSASRKCHLQHEQHSLLTLRLKYFCYPETANLTLEEVDWLFYEGNVVRRSRRIAKEGWDVAEGVAPQAQILETGSMTSSKRGDETAEKKERIGDSARS